MRIIGTDIHRMAAEVVSLLDGEFVNLGRVQMLRSKLEEFARKELTHDDYGVIEATGNAAALAEVLSPYVERDCQPQAGAHDCGNDGAKVDNYQNVRLTRRSPHVLYTNYDVHLSVNKMRSITYETEGSARVGVQVGNYTIDLLTLARRIDLSGSEFVAELGSMEAVIRDSKITDWIAGIVSGFDKLGHNAGPA